jgi:hypothetical protein
MSDFEGSNLMEELSLRQKSRTLWLREGSMCTKFFHCVANSNRRNNSIESLLVNGTVLQIILRLETTLCSTIVFCILSSSIGDLS